MFMATHRARQMVEDMVGARSGGRSAIEAAGKYTAGRWGVVDVGFELEGAVMCKYNIVGERRWAAAHRRRNVTLPKVGWNWRDGRDGATCVWGRWGEDRPTWDCIGQEVRGRWDESRNEGCDSMAK